jgi:MoxR-like ATPase
MDLPKTHTSDFDAIANRLSTLRTALQHAIFGQAHVIDLMTTVLLAQGHALLVGPPGVAKTRLVQAFGDAIHLQSKRVQFTPDLMPADILGAEILDQGADGEKVFRFIPGPIFTNILMADEINRASPRTQSALLQAMQEHHITIAGQPHHLPVPFHVFATQNPLEHEGTYPLPEAQLDRFLMHIDVTYPDHAAEKEMLLHTTGTAAQKIAPVMAADALLDIQQWVRAMPVAEPVVDAILWLTRECRPESTSDPNIRALVNWGPGPRGTQALLLACKAYALLKGEETPTIAHVHTLAEPVLKHRLISGFAAHAQGTTAPDLIRAQLQRMPF